MYENWKSSDETRYLAEKQQYRFQGDWDHLLRLWDVEFTSDMWNEWRSNEVVAPLFRYCRVYKLSKPNLDLRHANFMYATLGQTRFRKARCSEARFQNAFLEQVDFVQSDFSDAKFNRALISRGNLEGARFDGADLRKTEFRYCDLRGSTFVNANLQHTRFVGSDVRDANFSNAVLDGTQLVDIDLSVATGLEKATFHRPCEVSLSTLGRNPTGVPDSFWRGCGLAPWEISNLQLGDPTLTPAQVAEINNQVWEARSGGPQFLSRFFISCSSEDIKFSDKMYGKLYNEGARVWLYSHDMVAGPVEDQVFRAIRQQDVVLLVLSESSINSDWVEAELEAAISKEKEEGRDVLCPIALDDTWKAKVEHGPNKVLWRKIKEKNILDFSKWRTKVFNTQYNKLLKGLKIFYPPTD